MVRPPAAHLVETFSAVESSQGRASLGPQLKTTLARQQELMSPEDYKSWIIVATVAVAGIALIVVLLRYRSGRLPEERVSAFSSTLIGLIIVGIAELRDYHWLVWTLGFVAMVWGPYRLGQLRRRNQEGISKSAV